MSLVSDPMPASLLKQMKEAARQLGLELDIEG
jgi:hypothetical protein